MVDELEAEGRAVVGPSKTSERWERRRFRLAATSDVDRLVRDWRWSDLARCSFQRGSRSSTMNGKRGGGGLAGLIYCLARGIIIMYGEG